MRANAITAPGRRKGRDEVFAVNLRERIVGGPTRRYRPRRDFLCLLNLADGWAVRGVGFVLPSEHG